MASFYGTADELNHFLMPWIRNLVQRMTRPLKQRAGGACERCGRTGETLEAAHVHGRERKAIVAQTLEKYRSGSGYHIGDLSVLEQEIIKAHEPIEETFLFLCRDCHKEYDSEQRSEKEISANANGSNGSLFRGQPRNEGYGASHGKLKSLGDDLSEEFYDYLVNVKRCKEFTPKGRKGTPYSYQNAVDKICRIENCGWNDLPDVINDLVRDYGPSGPKKSIGGSSHNTVISALKAFSEFCEYTNMSNSINGR